MQRLFFSLGKKRKQNKIGLSTEVGGTSLASSRRKTYRILVAGAILLVFIIGVLSSCSNVAREKELEDEIKTLKSTISQNTAEIRELKQKIEGYENKPDKLIAELRKAYEEESYSVLEDKYQKLLEFHPESSEFKEAQALYDKMIADVQAKKEVEERERQQKAEEEKAKIEAEKQEKLKALNKLKKNYDDISGITWYHQPYFTHYNNSNRVSIYMGSKGLSVWLRLVMSYKGDNWIFFDKAYLSYEGNTREIFFDEYSDKKTDNDYGEVWEWFDIQVSSSLEEYLREFAQYKNAKMRFTGKYTKTRNLTWDERQGIRDVLKGYDALKEGLSY